MARQAEQGQGENSAARMKFATAFRELLNKLELEGRRMTDEPHRHGLPVTVANLAERVGVEPTSIYNYRSGNSRPRPATLKKILSVLPISESDKAILGRLHNGTDEVRPEPGSRWPRIPREIAGRQSDIAHLSRLIDADKKRGSNVVITGVPGVGKTTFAIEWARRRARRFGDGKIFVDLGGYGTSRPLETGEICSTILTELGMPVAEIPEGVDSRIKATKGWIERSRLLLVLDNARDADQVRDILPTDGMSCVLITTRDEMSALVAIGGALKLSLGVLDLPDSLLLLDDLLQVTGSRPADLTELCRRCGRLPLALRIAAEQVNLRAGLPLRDLLDDLADEQKLFDLLELDGDPRAALRTVFLWSYGHLPRELQMVFRMTGLSPGSHYDRYGLAALLDLSMEKVKESTRALVQVNLFEERYVGRFGSHDLLAVYGRELSTQTDSAADQCAAVQRIGDYYAITSAIASDTIYGSSMEEHLNSLTFTNVVVRDRERAIKWMSFERENIATFASECERFETEASTIDLSCTMSQFMIGTGHARQARDLHAAASASASRRNRPDVEASCLDRHAQAILSTGDAHAALDSVKRGLSLLDAAPDDSTRADLLHTRATCEARAGNFDRAIEDLQQVLAIPRASVTDWANTAAALADLYEDLGRYGLAREAYQDVLRDERIRPATRARVTNNLALIEYRVGRYQEAVAGFEESARLKRQIGDLQAAITSEANHGLALFHLGRSTEALLRLKAASEEVSELDDRWSAVIIGSNLAGMFHEAGVEDDAIRTHIAAVEAAREIRSLPLLAVVLNDYGETLARQDESDKAFEQHKEAYGLASQLSLAYETARALDGLGTALRLNGEVDRPRQAWDEAYVIFTSLRTPNAAAIAKKLADLPQSA